MSSVHKTGIAGTCGKAFIHAVDTAKVVARRLVATREALEIKSAELCRQTGIAPNRWSQYESGTRMITMRAAIKLREIYGVSLDFIYCGDRSSLPQRLLQKIKVAA
jgi:transcriptional regulator with XRE-family HTH domain